VENSLFIKQQAILEVIKDHKVISSKELQRRFLGIRPRTLRYHLRKLQTLGLIRKRGITNEVYYECISTSD
jgi:repressor of nif and glnA expression